MGTKRPGPAGGNSGSTKVGRPRPKPQGPKQSGQIILLLVIVAFCVVVTVFVVGLACKSGLVQQCAGLIG